MCLDVVELDRMIVREKKSNGISQNTFRFLAALKNKLIQWTERDK